MTQEEKTENSHSLENPTNDLESEKDSYRDENKSDLSPLANAGKADHLPVESIGSYARIDELLDGEGTEKRGRADSEN